MRDFDRKIVYSRMMLLCWTILAMFVGMKIITGTGIAIVANSPMLLQLEAFIHSHKGIYIIYNSVFSFVNISLFLTTILLVNRKEIRSFLWFYMILAFTGVIIKMLNPTVGIAHDVFVTMIVPYVFDKSKKWDIVIVNMFYFVFVAISMWLRSLPYNQYISDNSITMAFYYSDVYLAMFMLCIVSYYYGGVTKWVLEVFGGCRKILHTLNKLLNLKEIKATLLKRIKSTVALSNLSLKTKLRFYGSRYGLDTAILSTIAVFAYLNNSVLEAMVLFVCYIALRYAFPTTYHTKPIKCASLSVIIFCVATNNVLPLEVSLLSAVVVAFIVDWSLWLYQDRLNLVAKYDDDYTKYGLSAEMADFAKDWLNNGLKDKELLQKYDIASLNTLNSRKRRIKQAMNTI